jgi:hypothetical protein
MVFPPRFAKETAEANSNLYENWSKSK